MEIFERASRKQIRFSSAIGDLTTEQLWELPLTARSDRAVDLDKLARATNAELKSIEEGSFVNTTPDPRKIELELKLDLLKHVIASKIADKAEAEKAAETMERKRKILEIMASKKDAELSSKSMEELEAELAALSA